MNPFKVASFALLLAPLGCVETPVDQTEPNGISTTHFSLVADTADLCTRYAPDWSELQTAFAKAGYDKTSDQRSAGERVVIYKDRSADVVALMGLTG